MNSTSLIYDLDLPAIINLLLTWAEPAYRAKQIWQGLYQHYYNAPEEFTSLPKSLREKLADNLKFTVLTPETRLTNKPSKPSSTSTTVKSLKPSSCDTNPAIRSAFPARQAARWDVSSVPQGRWVFSVTFPVGRSWHKLCTMPVY
jgi:hypothetical protein